MKLPKLLEGAELSSEGFSNELEISRIVYDSRIVQNGDLFC